MAQEKGTNKYIESILGFINEDDKTNIDYFYLESLTREYKKINATTDVSTLLVNDDISYEDADFLLNYSGFNYKHINASLRGTWNSEENGDINQAETYLAIAYRLNAIINNHPTTLNDNITTYRGVDIRYFKQYGIESLDDLKSLEEKYMFDRGFVSTSIKEDKSFFKMNNELGLNYNIKIEYMIPHEFKDGILLGNGTSYSPKQEEFLINSSNLAKVSSVIVSDDNTAVLRASLIPKELYDDYYRNKVNKPDQI